MTEVPQLPAVVDLAGPSPARIYDYMLGGCHSRPADREAAAKLKDAVPEFHEIAWANRGFHQRAARWIADQGVRQFLDLGSGPGWCTWTWTPRSRRSATRSPVTTGPR